MYLEISAICDVGLKRKNNEDIILIGSAIFRDEEKNYDVDINPSGPFIAAVADGMGGHKAGELASAAVLERMRIRVNTLPPGLSYKELKNIFDLEVKDIHNNLCEIGSIDNSKKGMGSTLIAVVFYENKIFMINAGDSRLYRFRRGILKQLSRDHSLAEIMGHNRNSSHMILNSIGGGENVFIDFVDLTESLLENDYILLCSDGLSDMIPAEEIESILDNNPNVNELTKAAKKAGGKDNISIVLIKIG